MLAPAIQTVFVCTAVVALALLLSGLLVPRGADNVDEDARSPVNESSPDD